MTGVQTCALPICFPVTIPVYLTSPDDTATTDNSHTSARSLFLLRQFSPVCWMDKMQPPRVSLAYCVSPKNMTIKTDKSRLLTKSKNDLPHIVRRLGVWMPNFTHPRSPSRIPKASSTAFESVNGPSSAVSHSTCVRDTGVTR